MAVIKMGAIVTEIRGSIGGTSFKVVKGRAIAGNKSSGGAKNKLLQNGRLSSLTRVIQSWASIGSSNRASWNAQALNYQFPDKYGVLRNLTGRQFFIKLNGSLTLVNVFLTDANSLNGVIPTPVLSVNATSLSSGVLIGWTQGQENSYLLFRVQVIKATVQPPVITKRRVLLANPSGILGVVDIAPAMLAEYPFLQAGSVVRVFVTPMNSSGFLGSTQIFDVTLTA